MKEEGPAEVKRKRGFGYNAIALDLGGYSINIVFKSGGNAESPVTVHASAGGGVYADGIYDPWNVEGEVTVSPSIARWMLKAYNDYNFARVASATLDSYSGTTGVLFRRKFKNVRISKLIDLGVDDLAGDSSLKVSFSLNDLDSEEILDGAT